MRIFESPSATGRLEAARRFVLGHPPATELLLLGATREAVDDFARGIAVARRATFGLHRLTLTQLAARLAAHEVARRGLAPASALGARAVAVRAAYEAARGQDLAYLAPVATFPGFPAALAATLTELRLGAVRPEAVAGLPAPGPDLAALLGRLEEELERAGIGDRAALFKLATQAVSGDRDAIVRIPVLLLDVPLAAPAEAGLVRALAASSPAVLATVPAGGEPTLAALGVGAEGGPAGEAAPGGLGRLRRNVFALETAPPAPADEQVVLFSAPGEERECLEMARKLLEEARGGVPFDGMAILLRAPETYGALLEHALGRAEIPAYFARGTRRPDPSGRAFLTVLACAAEGLSAARFAEYLSLGQVPRLEEAGRRLWVAPEEELPGSVEPSEEDDADEAPSDADEAPVLEGTLRAPWRWERLLVEAAVIGGQERWRRRLEVLETRLRLELRAARAEEPDSGRARWLERELVNLGHLRGFSLPVVELLARLPAEATWGEWLEALEGLAPRVLRSPERVLGVLADLRPMAPVGPVTLDQVRAVLTEPLANLAEEPPPHRYGRVFVGTPEQARGREFEVVFLPGLAEGLFPRRPRQDPLLLDDLREQLNASSVPGTDLRLATEEDRLRQERLLLRLAAGAARRRLYLSYPRLDVQRARERVPSLYALEAQRAVLGRIPRLDELRAAAAAASGAWLAWPAPEDPALAIDAREHDLAVLRRLLRPRAPHPPRGRARYLFELNPHLARSLRARWARWRRGPWRPQDGLVDAAGALAGQRLRQRPYSVSALQRFAVCPYQFYLSSVWRLEPREEPAPLERLDAVTHGQMFHRAQAQLYRRLAAEGALPVRAGTLERAAAVLDGVLAGVAAEYGEELVPKVARVWQDEVEALRADLKAWLDHVAERDEGWLPADFEASFGLPGDDGGPPLSAEPVAVGDGYLLHGVVDLLERREEALRVTDHKTGTRVPAEGIQVGGGEVLQPVLYGLAVERATGREVVEGRLFYCTPAAGFQERTVPLHEMARDHGLEVLAIVDQAVEEGTLPPAPKEGACGWCDFRDVCGPHEERRSRRKDRLRGLAALRGLP